MFIVWPLIQSSTHLCPIFMMTLSYKVQKTLCIKPCQFPGQGNYNNFSFSLTVNSFLFSTSFNKDPNRLN